MLSTDLLKYSIIIFYFSTDQVRYCSTFEPTKPSILLFYFSRGTAVSWQKSLANTTPRRYTELVSAMVYIYPKSSPCSRVHMPFRYYWEHKKRGGNQKGLNFSTRRKWSCLPLIVLGFPFLMDDDEGIWSMRLPHLFIIYGYKKQKYSRFDAHFIKLAMGPMRTNPNSN